MKRFFFMLATVLICGVGNAAMLPDNDKDEDDTSTEEKEIMLEVLDRHPSTVLSVTPIFAKAYLRGQTVTVDLQEWAGDESITITEMATGAIVYQSDIVSAFTSIPLPGVPSGYYQIDIRSDGMWLQGTFNL